MATNLVEEMKDEDLELAAVGKELYLRSLEQNHCSHNKRKVFCGSYFRTKNIFSSLSFEIWKFKHEAIQFRGY